MSAPRSHRSVLVKLLAVVAGAFAFGFALVPLYDVFCQATGLNGKTRGAAVVAASGDALTRVDRERWVSVEFTGTVMPGLAWEMRPLTATVEVHPGELHQALFRVRNLSGETIVGQAVPSISPGIAARHFAKLDCFCFARQTLAAGETKDLPLAFIINPELDRDVRTITLAYAFYQADPDQPSATALAGRR